MLEDLTPPPPAAARARAAVLVLGLVGGVVLFTFLARSQADFAAADIGLGRDTFPTVAEFEGRRVSGPFEDMELLLETFAAYRAEGRRVALWLGASQLYAINQPRAEDRLAVAYAAERARERGSDLAYVMSANPNANLNELACAYLAFRQAGLVPDVLVLGFTYDDLKESGIRDLALEKLRPLEASELALGGECARHIADALAALGGGFESAAPVQRNAVAGTPQERLEDALVERIETAWPAYAERGGLRSAAIAAWKVPFTRLAFRVFTRPKRLVPPDRARWNEPCLAALLAFARADGAAVRVYKAPHRPAEPAEFYHERGAFDAAHVTLAQQLEDAGAAYRDLEGLVPAEHWGTTNDGSPDVFHFRDAGHRLLGDVIDQWLEETGF